MTTRIQVGDPSELFAALSCFIGFSPRNAIVVYAVSSAGVVLGVALLDSAACPWPQDVDGWQGLAARTIARLCSGNSGVLGGASISIAAFVGVDEVPDGDQISPADDQALAAIGQLRRQLDQVLHVDECWIVGPEWFRHLECEPSCCPPAGRRRHTALGIVAAFANAGYSWAEDKQTWLALEAPSRADRLSARRAALRWRRRREIAAGGVRFRPGLIPAALLTWREEALTLWRTVLSAADSGRWVPAPPDLGRLAESLADTVVRDATIIDLLGDRNSLAVRSLSGLCAAEVRTLVGSVFDRSDIAPGPRTVGAAAVLRSIATHAANGHRAPAFGVLSWLSWWRADNRRAVEFAREALADVSDHPLALLVCGMVETDLSPAWTRDGAAKASEEAAELRRGGLGVSPDGGAGPR